MSKLVSPDFDNPNFNFIGTTGLILFGDRYDQALSFTRDTQTTSFPLHVDFAGGCREGNESGFQTFQREVDEEFGISIERKQIEYTKLYPSLLNPKVLGWFTVARTEIELVEQIVFGDEGLDYQVTALDALRNHPMLIPRRAIQIDNYLAETGIIKYTP